MSAISAYRDYKLQGLRDSRAGKISGNLKVLAWYFSGWASHINNYWLFPIMAGIRPFHKSRSFCLMNGDVGAQADYYLVFSEFDRRCCLEDKTSADKIIVNGHPLEQSPELYLELRQEKASEKQPEYDIVYFQTDLGFRIEEYYDRLLPPLLDSKLRVAVKLHPGSLNNHGLLIYLDELGGRYANLTILSETDFYPAAAGAKVIAGETTSVLEISSFIFKDKPIISVNLNRLPLGERYKGHHAIIYTEDIDDIVRLAESGAAFSSAGTKPEQRDGKPIDVLLRELLER